MDNCWLRFKHCRGEEPAGPKNRYIDSSYTAPPPEITMQRPWQNLQISRLFPQVWVLYDLLAIGRMQGMCFKTKIMYYGVQRVVKYQ